MKTKKQYTCNQCGYITAKWLGKCTSCGAWDSFEEQEITKGRGKRESISGVSAGKIMKLSEISEQDNYRMVSDIKELDRVLGGGIIPGSLVLIGGDPGIGKSTLMLQMVAQLEKFDPLYISGEESLQQIKHRSQRLSGIPDSLKLMSETNLEKIVLTIESNENRVVIVDSIQSIYTDTLDAAPGSLSQVRECASLLMTLAKKSNKAIFIIGHVTKEGAIAGPKILEHMVDTVLHFEGEKTYSYRILRCKKNRFGSTNEIGIFEMIENGLREVANPSEIFLAQSHFDDPGIAIVSSMEGTRPIMLEVQALVSESSYSVPQRVSNGYDMRRLQMIIAILEKRMGIHFGKSDIFLNIAGGIHIADPSIDLGVAAALVSSLRDEALDLSNILIGELGLTGEVRPIAHLEQRIKEAEKLGFKTITATKQSVDKMNGKYNIKIDAVERISLAFMKIFA